MSNEDCFFIKSKNYSGIVLKDLGKTCLYSAVVAGDKDMVGDYLETSVYERVDMNDQKYQRVISMCLEEHYSDFNKEGKKHVLFSFPYQRNDMTNEEFKMMGFDVKRRDGDYLGIDMFGAHDGFSDRTTLTKNGAEINF